jgi:hypothetical protein
MGSKHETHLSDVAGSQVNTLFHRSLYPNLNA